MWQRGLITRTSVECSQGQWVQDVKSFKKGFAFLLSISFDLESSKQTFYVSSFSTSEHRLNGKATSLHRWEHAGLENSDYSNCANALRQHIFDICPIDCSIIPNDLFAPNSDRFQPETTSRRISSMMTVCLQIL